MKNGLVCTLAVMLIVGCKESNEPNAAVVEQPSVISHIEKTPELVAELKAQETIDDQLRLLYERFEPMLDRSDSLTGTDANNDGIRDDIEAFIDALEVPEPVRKALKQNAHYTQENLYHDFSQNTDANIKKALDISSQYDKVLACEEFVGIDIDDGINTSNTITSLTYNTKARTMAYLAYNHLQDGSVSTLLPAEAKYCE
ncbi:Chromosome partitioning protein ParA [Vibrio chagasii]|uniref:chromosome partitioning protein ParA n=1 Tax=Vibrio chagasii TaxID=170679 RepID=UPI001EFEE9CA|nr:chromosome partitioning protein ParA [Vibrio chagasii]MDE9380565.1 chromosome partitioning protein ParA [Vibrio alginolyticus]MCG9604149.1 chromosome partitioning protein ParA [Vibrio chagasii]CAH6949581.1 Chromosome partitioning protein ParA [Vibrio chagasii]CAH7117551.1 Chromosome partitioning protein ParA [Vibrio chagasii]CAH7229153.1 Chromosome partitioning protein ParA [Vibrio chagasii]